ncbi:hypothetical protein ACQJBY_061952 [Aegilops geniculata]
MDLATEAMDLATGTIDLTTGAMGSLLLKLGNLLKKEYELQTGVKEDIRYLERELRSMYAALCKVGDVPRDELDWQVKFWAGEVRDLSYTMEDVIDKFPVEGPDPNIKPHNKLIWLMKKISELFTKGKTRHEISKEIKDIKARVQEVADRRDRYKVNEVLAKPAGAAMVDPRLLALYKDQKELVGIDRPLNSLIKMLDDADDVDVSKQHKILSIFGFGGLAKTTLAKAVYDKLQAQFDCSAFVSVGQKPSVKNLLNDILFDLGKRKYPTLNEKQLIDKLRGFLKNKRYFIVIDDIWDTDTWEIIQCAFVDNNCTSRIVTTTRIFEVATKSHKVYKLQPLTHGLSMELFHTRLCGGNNKCPYDQSTMVNKILNKCGGVPLAIITIASVLVSKPMEDWSKVYNSIGFGDEQNKNVENTRKILLFSYYDLPFHLRTCLLYLSQYKEDSFIEKDSLIWRWAAEGFVHEEQGVGLSEIAERYFNSLINKSMIQPVDLWHHGIISHCRVHDMVLDMIRLLAKEEKFITLLDSTKQHTHSIRCDDRRLVIQGKSHLADTCMPHVRSFNAVCTDEFWPSLSSFQVLRVLVLDARNSNMGKRDHLEHLGKLVHLRYLGLRGVDTLELPKGIGNLKSLQALDMRDHKIKELPQSVCQLSHLKLLRADETDTRMPDWIGNLISLEELWMSEADESSNFVNELGKLTELRKLCITKKLCLTSASAVGALSESLAKLQKIKFIQIGLVESRGYDDTACCWEGFVLPRQLRALHISCKQPGLIARINPLLLPNLLHLSVEVDSPDMEIFGGFSELVTLQLDMKRNLHHDVMGGAGAFPKLRFFKTDATLGRFVEGAMPCLESLRFPVEVRRSNDGKIDDLVDFGSLRNLPFLREITVDLCYSTDVDLVEAMGAMRQAISMHPNRLKVYICTKQLKQDT